MGNSSISDEHVFFVALHFTTRGQLIVINQLDFFCFTGRLRYHFDFCLNREYDDIKSRTLLISSKMII
ncbi:hypothetical protein EA458_01800 [Streptococcus dysgalactiae subsp. dysgalactiae]|nr:hypothetical protein EA458_01800 [Streptococcus dysgalactiae subsp. dysgalactiae]